MLKLKDISTIQRVHNESDFYIKIKLIFDSQDLAKGPICYWSTLGPKKSFIEIGLKKPSGAIYELTIISPPNILYDQEALTVSKDVIKKVGLPLLETEAWSHEGDSSLYYPEHYQEGYYIREKKDFEIYANKTSVSLLFSQYEAVLHVLNDSIIFGFDDNNFLCFIRMEGMILNSEGFLEKIGNT